MSESSNGESEQAASQPGRVRSGTPYVLLAILQGLLALVLNASLVTGIWVDAIMAGQVVLYIVMVFLANFFHEELRYWAKWLSVGLFFWNAGAFVWYIILYFKAPDLIRWTSVPALLTALVLTGRGMVLGNYLQKAIDSDS
jgi:hypothetical protein